MALSAWLFALSPNLIAHGGLVTMELPLLAGTTGMLFLFWAFLTSGRWRVVLGLGRCGRPGVFVQVHTVLFPPILAVVWWLSTVAAAELHAAIADGGLSAMHAGASVLGAWPAYVLMLLLANVVVTGFAFMPLSQSRGDHPSIAARLGDRFSPWIARIYETPIPQDWVGFATQMHHQMSGGPSYLMGERRLTGWRYYYLVALAVKVPLTFWLLLAGRVALAARARTRMTRARLVMSSCRWR